MDQGPQHWQRALESASMKLGMQEFVLLSLLGWIKQNITKDMIWVGLGGPPQAFDGVQALPGWTWTTTALCFCTWKWNAQKWDPSIQSMRYLPHHPVKFHDHSEPSPTSAPSTGWPLILSCGWTSTEFIFGFILVTNSVGNGSRI